MNATQHVTWQSAGLPAAEGLTVDSLLVGQLLKKHGWQATDPICACGTASGYRDYIRESKGGWRVSKNGYVAGLPDWFSCRSACHLAAGCPVVVQDTGFSRVLPVGVGILAFSSRDEAIAVITAVEVHYPRHAGAAREFASEYSDSNRVLTRLLEHAFT